MVHVQTSMNVSIQQAVQIIIIHLVPIRRAPINVDVTMVIQSEVLFLTIL